ncbi:unnamed protein product, partial [Callosobruchus maculatus]
MQNRHKPSMPMPSKRTSVMARSPDRDRHDSAESSSDEDSLATEDPVGGAPDGGGGGGGGTPDRPSRHGAFPAPAPLRHQQRRVAAAAPARRPSTATGAARTLDEGGHHRHLAQLSPV